MRIDVLKKADACVGRLLVNLLPQVDPETGGQDPGSILLIRPGGIGDAVLLSPAILALKEKFPSCRIDVLAERRNAQVFGLCPAVERVDCYDRGGTLLRVLRRRYDVVIDTEQWHRLSAVVVRLIRSRLKIGFGTNERRRMFGHAVDYRHDRYEADSFFDLLASLGISPGPVEMPFLTVPEAARKEVAKLLSGLGGRPFVALFPGASIAERRWGGAKFRELAAAIVQQGRAAVVVGGPEDREVGDFIVEGLAPGLNLAGRTSLAGSAAVLSQAQMLVSGDSGVLHLAVGLGVPTVSLFGPGIAEKWAPRGDRHVVIRRHLDCSPCTRFGYTPDCPVGARCIQEISVEEVLRGVASLSGGGR
ncbi:lipopolysaccharide heptosyltransferase II [Geothermobacter ehrlichii]|uniref:Lipopolysaccharide heptosyltransferase II n=1 Tax=Geothermobacter ehrlichii TaxID=213224 RepID=A0A5D3WNP1_9BACT|nr:glycosyltransferase family 9 protein [Geothermobacter ehrlichii]TYO99953.1 lipopolysaccharide heptosyltransferase II [Geothermobacter ehrlichii]